MVGSMATVCSVPGKPSKQEKTREQLIERCYAYRNRISQADDAIAEQKQQLGQLRQQVGSVQSELDDVQKQLETQISKRQELERLLFSERRKRPRVGDGHDQEALRDNGLRNRLLKVLRIVHPDRADPDLKLGPHEISAAINDLIAGGTGEAVFGCKAQRSWTRRLAPWLPRVLVSYLT